MIAGAAVKRMFRCRRVAAAAVAAGLCLGCEPGLADDILCEDGLLREGLVLKHWPDKREGPVIVYIPFKDGQIDSSHNPLGDRDEWDQKCDVQLSPCEHRSRMIEAWRRQVPTARVTRRDGTEATLLRAGIGVGASGAAVCIGYCGRSRALELREAGGERYLTLKEVRKIAVTVDSKGGQVVDYETIAGEHMHGALALLEPGPRYFYVYGWQVSDTCMLADVKVKLRDIAEIEME